MPDADLRLFAQVRGLGSRFLKSPFLQLAQNCKLGWLGRLAWLPSRVGAGTPCTGRCGGRRKPGGHKRRRERVLPVAGRVECTWRTSYGWGHPIGARSLRFAAVARRVASAVARCFPHTPASSPARPAPLPRRWPIRPSAWPRPWPRRKAAMRRPLFAELHRRSPGLSHAEIGCRLVIAHKSTLAAVSGPIAKDSGFF